MSLRHEPCTLVASTVSVYRASLVDLRYSRTVHYVDTFPCLPYTRGASGAVDCCAVHYGLCVPVIVRLDPPSLEVDLQHLVDSNLDAAAASTSPRPSAPPPRRDLSMLTLTAAAASSPPSSSSSAPGSPTARPLSAVSSCILSAVERLEQKGLRLNKTDHRRSPTPKAETNGPSSSSSSGGGGGGGGETPSRHKEKAKASGVVDTPIVVAAVSPTPAATAPQYDSCTWPSFKRAASKKSEPPVNAGPVVLSSPVKVGEAPPPPSLVNGKRDELDPPEKRSEGRQKVSGETNGVLGDAHEKKAKKARSASKSGGISSSSDAPGKKPIALDDGHAKKTSSSRKSKGSLSNGPSPSSSPLAGTQNAEKRLSPASPSFESGGISGGGGVGAAVSSPPAKKLSSADELLLRQELDKILQAHESIKSSERGVAAVAASAPAGRSSSNGVLSGSEGEASEHAVAGPLSSDGAKDKDPGQCILSPVDYAKSRFRSFQPAREAAVAAAVGVGGRPSAQQQQQTTVTVTKNRFENGQIHNSLEQWRPEWLPLQQGLGDEATEASLVQAAVDALKRGVDVRQPQQQQQPQQQRKASSPEPAACGGGGVANPSLPHPKLTTTQKQHIRERSQSPTGYNAHVPIRPFLTKGSVAERVLIFERCPTVDREKAAALAAGKAKQHQQPLAASQAKAQQSAREKEKKDTTVVFQNTTSNNLSKLQQNINIPRFYFPHGRPASSKEIDVALQRIATAFSNLENNAATKEQFGIITKACDLPLYWKIPLFNAAVGDKKGYVQGDVFIVYWKKILASCHDDASRFVKILTKQTRNYLLPEDFVPLLQDVVNTHPGLTFLKEAIEFHSRYVHTVIARIYYSVNRSWTGRITMSELRKSNFLQVAALLEEEDDINQITEYFSYEHFYVIYCKFWELDKDHDLYIDKTDLSRHNDHAISSRMIDRIFSGAVTRGHTQKEHRMSYTEFVWFLLSEEDKRHPTSIEYWFRCMDLDGDGYLSMYELEFFYEEQLQRMEALGIETLPFKDCLCQMLDMIRPNVKDMISLRDLKNCRMTPIFFDTFFNLEKYLDHEQRDPFATQRDHDIDGPEISDWDRYAAEEYEFLVAEEGANDQQDDLAYEDDEDELSSNLEKLVLKDRPSQHLPNNMEIDEDYADYADYADSDDYQY